MNRALRGLLLLGSLLAAPTAARAATPIDSAIELKLGSYLPEIDSEPGLTGAPYARAFGDKSILLFELEYERQLFQKFGSLAVGASVGYGEVYGKGTFATGAQTGQASGDSTALKVFPLKLLAIYRFDVLARRFDIPLVPFGKVGLVGQGFRITDGAGDVAVDSAGNKGQGVRLGWEAGAGLALQLDWFDTRLARDFDLDLGVNHTYLFAEWKRWGIDGFGSTGLRLSDSLWSFGLAVEL